MTRLVLIALLCLTFIVVSLEARVRRPYHDEEEDMVDSRQPQRRRWRGLGFNFGSRRRKPHGHDWGFNWNFRVPSPFEENERRGTWWEGPNVCQNQNVSREDEDHSEEAITRHLSMKTEVCDETETSFKCTTTTFTQGRQTTAVEIFECCHGFSRKPGEYGCPREIHLRDLIETAQELDLSEFIRVVQSVSMESELREGNFTIFAPVNSAFLDAENLLPDVPQSIPRNMESVVVVSTQRLNNMIVADMQDILLGHVVGGIHKTSSLSDEMVLETGSPYRSQIRVNFYDQPEKIMTANCRRVTSKDNQASNGVIHVVEDILHPVTESLTDIISSNPQLGYMKTALGQTGLSRLLREDGQYTLIAPTDEAFRKMDERLRQRLFRGEACLEKVMKHLLLPNVICSAIIQGKAQTVNMNNQLLKLNTDEDGKLFVESAQVVDRDIMATNGVLHLIDEVLIPDTALGVLDLIEKNNNTVFMELLEQAEMVSELDEAQNITIFLPTNAAMENIDEAVLSEMIENPEKLESFIFYHISPSTESCRSYRNNHRLETLDGDKRIRINEYFNFRRSWIQTAECAPIIRKNIQACNGQIHLINKVMIPPQGNVVDMLALDARFSRMIELLKKSGLADTLQEDGPFTVFALTNEVLDKIGEDRIDRLLEDQSTLQAFLKNHISENTVCCVGITGNNWFNSQRLMMMSGKTFQLGRSYLNDISVGPARIEKCDIGATNGIIHVVDTILAHNNPSMPWDFDDLLDDIFDIFT